MDLIDAVIHDDYMLAKQLLEDGANPNLFEDGAEVTPLLFAVQRKKTAIIVLLLKHGADPFFQEKMLGESAYDFAVSTGLSEIAKLLSKNTVLIH